MSEKRPPIVSAGGGGRSGVCKCDHPLVDQPSSQLHRKTGGASPTALSGADQAKQQDTRSLYERLGKIFSIAAVVDHFSNAVLENPVVGKNSQNALLRDWSRNKAPTRLPGLKFMRTLWLASVSGGPYTYTPTAPGACPFSLENAHAKLQISPAEFDAVAAELAKSLDHFSVPPREKQEVLSAFAAHKGEVNQGFFLANEVRFEPVSCPHA